MFIKRWGNGARAFLGLHGWSGDHGTFTPLVRDLPAEVSFFAMDLPGCGASQAPTRWSLDEIANSIAAAARTIPAPFTLVGNCSGGLLGMLAARQLRGRIERMVTIDLFANFPWYFRIFLQPVIGPVAYYSTFANPIGRWVTNASLRDRRKKETTLTGGFSRVDHASTYRYLKLFENYPAPRSFYDLQVPTDLVYGANTFRAVVDSVPRWQAVWPHAREWRLEGAGHLPILEATASLRDILFNERSVSTECLVPSSTIAD